MLKSSNKTRHMKYWPYALLILTALICTIWTQGIPVSGGVASPPSKSSSVRLPLSKITLKALKSQAKSTFSATQKSQFILTNPTPVIDPTTNLPTTFGKNFIINGDFSDPVVRQARGFDVFSGSILGWSGDSIEIAEGRIYNSVWNERQVLHLKVNDFEFVTVTQEVVLRIDQVVLTLEYAATTGFAELCHFKIAWNTVEIADITTSNQDINTYSKLVDSISMTNTLTISGYGASEETGMTISGVTLRIVRGTIFEGTANEDNNYVANGDITQPVVTGVKDVSSVPGWVSSAYKVSVAYWQNPKWSLASDLQVLVLNPEPARASSTTIFVLPYSNPYRLLLSMDFSNNAGGVTSSGIKIVFNQVTIMTIKLETGAIYRFIDILPGALVNQNQLSLSSTAGTIFPISVRNVILSEFSRKIEAKPTYPVPLQGTVSFIADNLITNGNFATPVIATGSSAFFTSVPGWAGVSQIQLFQALILNPKWEMNLQALTPETVSTPQTFTQTVSVETRIYRLSYSWAAKDGTKPASFKTKWNNVDIALCKAVDSVVRIAEFIVAATQGDAILAFASGDNNDAKSWIGFSKVALQRLTQPNPAPTDGKTLSNNLITNGDFVSAQVNPVKVFTNTFGTWLGKKIMVSKGHLANPKWGQTVNVVMLYPTLENSPLTTVVTLQPKRYVLSADWASNSGGLTKSAATVSVGAEQLIALIPLTDDLSRYYGVFDAATGPNTIKFQSVNTALLGVGLRAITLFRWTPSTTPMSLSVPTVATTSKYGTNLILNGEFDVPLIMTPPNQVFDGTAFPWKTKVKLAVGSSVNAVWDPTAQVCDLDTSASAGEVSQQIILQAIYYTFRFNWSPRSTVTTPSGLTVLLNNNPIAQFSSNDIKLRDTSMIFQAVEGKNIITFKASSTQGQTFDMVDMRRYGTEVTIDPNTGTGDGRNLAINPLFATPPVETVSTITNNIQGWTGPNITISQGYLQNPSWGYNPNTQVCALDPSSSKAITQTLMLEGVKYLVSMDYAAPSGGIGLTGFTLSVNGKNLPSVTANTITIRRFYAVIEANRGINTFTFSSFIPYSMGVTMRNFNVQQFKYNAQKAINPLPQPSSQIIPVFGLSILANGAFAEPVLTASTQTFTTGVTAWNGGRIRLVKGASFNPTFSGTTQALYIDFATGDGIVSNTFKTQKRSYLLTFAAASDTATTTPRVNALVLLNGKVLGQLAMIDSFIRTIGFFLSGVEGSSILAFKPVALTPNAVGMMVTNIKFERIPFSQPLYDLTKASVISPNLIQNPLFDNPVVSSTQVTTNPALIPSWTSPPNGQIGKGYLFNPAWSFNSAIQVIALDRTPNKPFSQTLTLEARRHVLLFEYAPTSGGLTESSFVVTFNSETIATVTPTTDTITLFSGGVEGILGTNANTLAFSSVNTLLFSVTIRNVQIYRIIVDSTTNDPKVNLVLQTYLAIPTSGSNLIKNGQFNANPITAGQTSSLFAQGITSWVGTNVKITSAKTANPAWGDNVLGCQIDSTNAVDTINQVVSGQPRFYLVKFNWAPRALDLPSSGLKVYWNNVIIAEFASTDANLRLFQFMVFGITGSNTLKFEDYKVTDDSKGMVFTNVEIKRLVDTTPSPTAGQPVGSELIQNLDFANPAVTSIQTNLTQIPSWTGTNITVAKGSEINPKWGDSTQVCQLDSRPTSTLDQIVPNLEGFRYLLQFGYSMDSGLFSGIDVYWNDVKVGTVTPTNDDIAKGVFVVDGMLGDNELSFQVPPSATESPKGLTAAISGVSLKKFQANSPTDPPTVYSTPQQFTFATQDGNLVMNPDFALPSAGSAAQFSATTVPSWTIKYSPIKIGVAALNNPAYEAGLQAVLLDSSSNVDQISQVLQLEKRRYMFTFTYSATTGNLDTSGLQATFNGALIAQFAPTDLSIRTAAFILQGKEGENPLKIIDFVNPGDSRGALVTKLRMLRLRETSPLPANGIPDGANYITNGGIEKPVVQTVAIAVKSIPNFAGNKITVGRGYYFNTKWGRSIQVIALDPRSAEVLTVSLTTLPFRRLMLQFDFAPYNGAIAQSTFTAKWNGVVLKDYTAVTESLARAHYIVESGVGQNLLTFQSGVCANFGFTIANVRVRNFIFESATTANPLTLPAETNGYILGVNAIVNSYFAKPGLGGQPSVTFTQPGVFLGWTKFPIKISDAKAFNPTWSVGQIVVEIGGISGTVCVLEQSMTLESKAYFLNLQWSIKPTFAANAGFKIQFNSNLIAVMLPYDRIDQIISIFVLNAKEGENVLKITDIKGAGGNGAGIRQVNLQAIIDEPQTTGDNLLKNSMFQDPKLTTDFKDFTPAEPIPFWASKLAQLGRAAFYNPSSQSNQLLGLYITPNGGEPVSQTVKCPEGLEHTVFLELAANLKVGTVAYTNITWNSKIMGTFGTTSAGVKRVYLIVNCIDGDNILSFVPFGAGSGSNNIVRLAVGRVEMKRLKGAMPFGENLMVNGAFALPPVSPPPSQVLTTGITGWSGKSIELGIADTYNFRWGLGNQACRLDPSKPNTMIQAFNVNEGTYVLDWNWAGVDLTNIVKTTYRVYWNRRLVAELSPADLEVNFERYSVDAYEGINILKVEAMCWTVGTGVTVHNFKLWPDVSSLSNLAAKK